MDRIPPATPASHPTPASSPRRRRFLAACVAALGASAAGAVRAQGDDDAVSLDVARAEQAARRAILVDVREPDEHATGVVAGALLLPLSQLGARWNEIPTDPSRPVLLICRTQNRSRTALRALRERGGYRHVRYVAGGMSEWARRGWPLASPGR